MARGIRVLGAMLGPRVLCALDALAQHLVPPRADQVAWASDPDYVGSSFHLYRHLLTTRPGLRHVWLATDATTRARVERDLDAFGAAVAPGAAVRVVRRHSLRGYWARLRSRWVFHTHGLYPMRTAPRRSVVSLWHGMPIKCIGALNKVTPNPHPTFGTLHLATSHLFRYVIAAAFRAPVDDVLLSALPRCDVLVSPHRLGPDPAAVRAALGVPEGRRLVMWLPTYRVMTGEDPPAGAARPASFLDDLSSEQWAQLDDAARANGCQVVVKLHPHDQLNRSGHDLGLGSIRLMRSEEWIATGMELYDALAAVDGLVSDISSVVIDLLPTNRPIGMVGFDPATYTRDVVFPVAVLRDSDRIHDLADPRSRADFFERIGSGRGTAGLRDDLSPWLHEAELGTGCEDVLRAVGL